MFDDRPKEYPSNRLPDSASTHEAFARAADKGLSIVRFLQQDDLRNPD